MVIRMAKVRIEQQGRILLPKTVRDKLGLRVGEELLLEERDGVITLRPAISFAEFAASLKGCIHGSSLDPLDVKKIWKM